MHETTCTPDLYKELRDTFDPLLGDMHDGQAPPLRTVCAWCERVMREGIEPVTHGICSDCRQRQTAFSRLPICPACNAPRLGDVNLLLTIGDGETISIWCGRCRTELSLSCRMIPDYRATIANHGVKTP